MLTARQQQVQRWLPSGSQLVELAIDLSVPGHSTSGTSHSANRLKYLRTPVSPTSAQLGTRYPSWNRWRCITAFKSLNSSSVIPSSLR